MRTSLARTNSPLFGAARGGVALLLRAEGLGLLIAASCAYAKLDGRWGWFAALFLVPDLSMLGYLLGPRFGALCYNSTHSTLGALSLAGIGFAVGSLMMMLGACIWLAHIGFDRMLGYGLKYASAFQDTHLGRALRGRPAVAEGRDGDALASRAKATA